MPPKYITTLEHARRTSEGIARAKAEGVRLGRPKVHVDLSRALQELSRGVSQGKVAAELGVSLSTLKTALAKHGVRAVKTWRVPD